MNELTKRIKEGRRKGQAIRDTRWLKRASASYKKMTADSEEHIKSLRSTTRHGMVLAVLGVLSMLFGAFLVYESGSTFDEELAGLEAAIEELSAEGAEEQVNILQEIWDSKQAEENQIEEDAARLKMTPEVFKAGLRLIEYMNKLPADDDGIYCPTCNRGI